MDRTIIGAGGVLTALGLGFFVAGELAQDLHSAFGTGGFLWIVVGALTMGIGLRIGGTKIKEKPLKVGAV